MKKFWATIGVLLIFGFISPLITALQNLIGNGFSGSAMGAGIVSGIISLVYWGIAYIIIRELWDSIDRKKRQKEVAEKEAKFREERRLAQEAQKQD